jgi:hypothetical protein
MDFQLKSEDFPGVGPVTFGKLQQIYKEYEGLVPGRGLDQTTSSRLIR